MRPPAFLHGIEPFVTEKIVIIGGGFAGLTAANRLAQHGLIPLVLEAGSEALYMCNSRICTGSLHVSYHSPTSPADDLFRIVMEGSGETAREDLARALTDRAATTIDWMKAEGAEFQKHAVRDDGTQMLAPLRKMKPGLDWENSGPNLFMKALESSLLRRGGNIRRGCRAKRILRDGDQITGLEITTGGGTEIIAADTIVIADGGFQANPELVARYISGAADALQPRNAGTAFGDGLCMAVEIGAATVGLETLYGHVLSRDAMNNDKLWPYPQLDLVSTQGVVVDATGRRFADEGLGGIHMANSIARLDDPLSTFAIFDSAVWENAGHSDQVPPNPSVPDEGGTVLTAESIEVLAKKAGLDPATLTDTVEGFNDCVRRRSGATLEPKRSMDRYAPWAIEEAPFHAIPLCAGITATSGGLAVNGKGRVMDEADNPIPGLYAAGSAVGGIEGGPNSAYVGGLIKAFAIGLIAADTISGK
jgi:fumarate reductase flavoprotein subunit